jgi:hypothetical protein
MFVDHASSRALFACPAPSSLEIVTRFSQDDFCILLSKNIEPEERKQPFPSDAAPYTVAQAAAAVETIQNYSKCNEH